MGEEVLEEERELEHRRLFHNEQSSISL